MRAYPLAEEESLRLRELLRDWHGEGLISDAQYSVMEAEVPCGLRRTNIFLRVVLFLFTLLVVGAGTGLIGLIFLQGSGSEGAGILFLLVASATYGAAEFAVSEGRFYRHGIEEALACCSVGFVCAALEVLLASSVNRTAIPIAGMLGSLWIWHRFGLAYAYAAAMIFACWIPAAWAYEPEARRGVAAIGFACAAILVAAVRRKGSGAVLDLHDSMAEALSWAAAYLAINLHLTDVDQWGRRSGFYFGGGEMSRAFYWTSWVLTWVVPAVILLRGLKARDRIVSGVGGVAMLATLITNKSYLGWPRHSWDPMLLGMLLVAIALVLRRWLEAEPEHVRNGYTARRLSGRDKALLSAGVTVVGTAAPQTVLPAHTPHPAPMKFGGGDAGGAGATSDF